MMRIRDASDPIEAGPSKAIRRSPGARPARQTRHYCLPTPKTNRPIQNRSPPVLPRSHRQPKLPPSKWRNHQPRQSRRLTKRSSSQRSSRTLRICCPTPGPEKSAAAAPEPATSTPPPVVAQEAQPAPPALDANGTLPSAADDSHFVTATRRAVARRLGDGQAVRNHCKLASHPIACRRLSRLAPQPRRSLPSRLHSIGWPRIKVRTVVGTLIFTALDVKPATSWATIGAIPKRAT